MNGPILVRKFAMCDFPQYILQRDLVKPIGYISQEIYEAALKEKLPEEDAAYIVKLYNEDLLFFGTGYFCEMRRIPYEAWSNLRDQFEVRE